MLEFHIKYFCIHVCIFVLRRWLWCFQVICIFIHTHPPTQTCTHTQNCTNTFVTFNFSQDFTLIGDFIKLCNLNKTQIYMKLFIPEGTIHCLYFAKMAFAQDSILNAYLMNVLF